MNKNDVVERVAQRADVSKSCALRTVDAVIEAIAESLARGEPVTLVGLGTFTVSRRAARVGHDPRTRRAIEIGPSQSARFRASKLLKDTVAAGGRGSA